MATVTIIYGTQKKTSTTPYRHDIQAIASFFNKLEQKRAFEDDGSAALIHSVTLTIGEE